MKLIFPFIPLTLAGSLLLLAGFAMGQDSPDGERLLNSDPQQLLELSQEKGSSKTMTTLADFENRDVREAPANVQVITARQIKASGARDLYEALQLAPGLSFGLYKDDMIGVAIHGNWAATGNCLFLLDGRPVNENDQGTFGIDQRIPLANVDRIEVLIGPASVMHGGHATLGVINIVTRSADQGTGARASLSSGYSADRITSTKESISGSHRLSRDQEISYMGSNERGRRSNALRLLPDSTLLNFADSTELRTSSFQLNYRWRSLKLSIAFIEETYGLSQQSYSLQSRAVMFGIGYDLKLSRKLELGLHLDHSDQLPWFHLNSTDPELLAANTENQHMQGRAILSYRPTPWLTGRIGVESYYQHTTFSMRSDGELFKMNDAHSIDMVDNAVFGQVALAGKPGMLSGSYRIEHNSLAGAFASPQIAYTKVLGPLNMKVLWGRSFRTPTVMNLNYSLGNEALRPEQATTKAAELGAKLGKTASVSVNVYNTQIDNPVMYVYAPAGTAGYRNGMPTGTKGVDARFNWETKRTTIMGGFGTFQRISMASDPELAQDSTGAVYPGLPANRAFLVVSWDAHTSFTLRAKAMWNDSRWSYGNTVAPDGALQLVEWPEELILSAGLTWHPWSSNRLGIELDVKNLLDTEQSIVAPVSTNYTPAPFALNGRTVAMRFTYKFVN